MRRISLVLLAVLTCAAASAAAASTNSIHIGTPPHAPLLTRAYPVRTGGGNSLAAPGPAPPPGDRGGTHVPFVACVSSAPWRTKKSGGVAAPRRHAVARIASRPQSRSRPVRDPRPPRQLRDQPSRPSSPAGEQPVGSPALPRKEESVLARSWLIPTARFGGATLTARRSHSSRAIVPTRPSWRCLIGQAVVASTAAGRGPRLLAPCGGGPAKDQPVPTVVRCRERQQDVAPKQ
jgi:hypothetical protein